MIISITLARQKNNCWKGIFEDKFLFPPSKWFCSLDIEGSCVWLSLTHFTLGRQDGSVCVSTSEKNSSQQHQQFLTFIRDCLQLEDSFTNETFLPENEFHTLMEILFLFFLLNYQKWQVIKTSVAVLTVDVG